MHSWMPDNKSNTSLMSHQVNNGFLKVSQQSTFRNLPDLDRTVLGATGYHVVIVWTPMDVENGRAVTHDQRAVTIDTSNLPVTGVIVITIQTIVIR